MCFSQMLPRAGAHSAAEGILRVCCWGVLQLYKNLWGAVLQGSKVLERASWWSDFVNKPVVGGLKSNL